MHQLLFADVMKELKSKRATTVHGEGLLDRFTTAWQHVANERRIEIVQISGGEIGQHVYIMDENDSVMDDSGFGFIWKPYSYYRVSNTYLDTWRNNVHSLKKFHHFTDEDWCKRYATKIIPSELYNNKVIVRLMIGSIPNTPEFAEFEELEDSVFMMRYPGFIPVDIMINKSDVVQRSVKYTPTQRKRRDSSYIKK